MLILRIKKLMKLLVVEDEEELLLSIKEYLEDLNHIIETANSYQLASQKLWDYEYDIVILDIMLPDGSGIDLIKEVKKASSNTGIIIISAKDSIDDRLRGLDLGADDYLTKPFYLSELNSRLRAINRRRFLDGNDEIFYKEISINEKDRNAKVNNSILELTRKEFDLLLYLMVNRGRVLTKGSIVEHLWGNESENLDNLDFLYTHIRNLRNKIAINDGHNYIKTVYSIGYKFGEK
jgi:DNA-binding response OmpR family regulator